MPLGVIWEIEKIKHHIEQIVVVVRKFIEPEMSEWLSEVKWTKSNGGRIFLLFYMSLISVGGNLTFLVVCLGLVDLWVFGFIFILIWILIEVILISFRFFRELLCNLCILFLETDLVNNPYYLTPEMDSNLTLTNWIQELQTFSKWIGILDFTLAFLKFLVNPDNVT